MELWEDWCERHVCSSEDLTVPQARPLQTRQGYLLVRMGSTGQEEEGLQARAPHPYLALSFC